MACVLALGTRRCASLASTPAQAWLHLIARCIINTSQAVVPAALLTRPAAEWFP
jgi:hypothetical protein